jgi:hypothetical protein
MQTTKKLDAKSLSWTERAKPMQCCLDQNAIR